MLYIVKGSGMFKSTGVRDKGPRSTAALSMDELGPKVQAKGTMSGIPTSDHPKAERNLAG